MAKVSYVGISSKARKVKKLFVGINGKARKVKKAYIGVGGKARLFFSSGFAESLWAYGGATNYKVDPDTMACILSRACLANQVCLSGISGKQIYSTCTFAVSSNTMTIHQIYGELNPDTGSVVTTVDVPEYKKYYRVFRKDIVAGNNDNTLIAVHPKQNGTGNTTEAYTVCRDVLDANTGSVITSVEVTSRTDSVQDSYRAYPATGSISGKTILYHTYEVYEDGGNQAFVYEFNVPAMTVLRFIWQTTQGSNVPLVGVDYFSGRNSLFMLSALNSAGYDGTAYEKDYSTLAIKAQFGTGNLQSIYQGRYFSTIKP